MGDSRKPAFKGQSTGSTYDAVFVVEQAIYAAQLAACERLEERRPRLSETRTAS